MRFPNAYNGVRRLFTTELLIWFPIALTIFFPLGFQAGENSEFLSSFLTVVSLVLAAAATVTRVLAIGCVALDEDSIRPGQGSTLIAFGFLLNNLTLLPIFDEWFAHLEQDKSIVLYRELLVAGRTCMPVVMQAAALYYYLSATLILIFGLECLAHKSKNGIIIELGVKLKWVLTGLFLLSLLASILNAALPEKIALGLPFRITVGAVLLPCLIVTGVSFLRYLRKAEDMLFYVKSKDEFIWTGIASELIPDKYLQDTGVEPDYPPDDDDVHYWPVEALNAPSKWVRDAELFFKGKLQKDEEEAELDATPGESGLSQCLKRLFIAEAVCLFAFLTAFLSVMLTAGESSLDYAQVQSFSIPITPWYCALFGIIAWYLQWSALRRASIEPQPWYIPSKRILSFSFWVACVIFVTPVFLYLFRLNEELDFEFLSFKSTEYNLFDVFSFILRLVWVAIPILATPRILSGLGYLAALKENWAELRRWRTLSRLAYLFILLLILSFFVPFALFFLLAVLSLTGLWVILLRDLFRTRRALRLAEEAEQDKL